MSRFRKYDALLVDENMQQRMTLKQFTTYVYEYGKVMQCGTLEQALVKLNENENIDMVFVSHRFDQSAIHRFINQAKSSRQGRDSSYILVVETKKQDASTAVKDVLGGADGLLLEPYSVESLVEITKIAVDLRNERVQAREEAALRFLSVELINQLNQVADNLAQGEQPGQAWRSFRESCAVLATLQPESLQHFFDIYSEVTIDLPPPQRVLQRLKYDGASSRVKKRLAQQHSD